jgi:hypothetical protein
LDSPAACAAMRCAVGMLMMYVTFTRHAATRGSCGHHYAMDPVSSYVAPRCAELELPSIVT